MGLESKETEKLFRHKRARKLPQGIQRVARRKLEILEAVEALQDLRIPPSNRLERLSGDRKGQYSIRINDQWRICFEWRKSDAFNIEIVDSQKETRMTEERLPPIHPGEILLEEFLKPMGISRYRLAKSISVPAQRINEIVHSKPSYLGDLVFL
jgi:proteic killer suppression protein